jgi:hypothetical protein
MTEDANAAEKRRGNLETAVGGVNSRARARDGSCAGAALRVLPAFAVAAMTACIQPPRAVPPVAPGAWPTAAGDASRSGHADEIVPADPQVVWREQAGRGFTAGIIVQDPVIIAATTNRAVVALSTATGARYWIARFRGPVAGPALRRDDMVYAAVGGREERVIAMNLQRGRRGWSRRLEPIAVELLLAGDAVIAAAENGVLYALDPAEGRIRWETHFTATPAVAPVEWRDNVLHMTRRDTLYRVEAATGRVLNRVALGATPSAPPAVHDGRIVVPLFSGEVVAIELPELREAWRFTLREPVLAAPAAAADGSVYLLTRAADVLRVRAGATAPDTVASLGGAASGSFTLARDGLLVGRLDGCLFFVDFNGAIVWERGFEDSLVAPVAPRDGALYVPLLRGELVKLR